MLESKFTKLEQVVNGLNDVIGQSTDPAVRSGLEVCRNRGGVLQAMLKDLQNGKAEGVDRGQLYEACDQYIGSVNVFLKGIS